MKLYQLMALLLLGCSSVSNSENEIGFADLLIHPDWIKVDGDITASILSEYSDKVLVAETFRYKGAGSIIVRVFPDFSEVTVNNDSHCLSEAKDIIIPDYDFVSGKARGIVYRYPRVVIIYSLDSKRKNCPENLGSAGYFYSLNSSAESVGRLLPHISEKAARDFCRIDARAESFSIGLISFDQKSLPSADGYLKDTGNLQFDIGGAEFQLSFALDIENNFTPTSCRKTGK